jgi:protocatechuate 3,4-dioxygenase beta subunit
VVEPGQGTSTCSGRPTPGLTEGPYFKPGSPERTSLLQPGVSGTQLVLTGTVLSVDCAPQSGAVLDFWQADGSGSYDNSGYRLRGHQTTDAGGRYTLTTVVPGEYPGRTEHIHVKVAAEGSPLLTTQLFFPGVARNSSDSIFDPALVVRLGDGATGKTAAFDFVLRA